MLVSVCNLSITEDSMLQDQHRHSVALQSVLDPRIAAVERSLEAISAWQAQSLLQTHLALAFDYFLIITVITYNVCMQPMVSTLFWFLLPDSMTHARHDSCNTYMVQGSDPQPRRPIGA